jgi:FkbM family methyltransferase
MKLTVIKRLLLNFYRLPRYLLYFFKVFLIFKNPISIIYFYILRESPSNKIIELRDGLKIFLSDHESDLITVFVVFIKEDYGKVKSGATVLDIGANIGSFSLFAAHFGAAKIYAYEPNKSAYEILLKNIVNNHLEDVIIPHNMAILDKNNETVKIPSASSPYNEIVINNSNNTNYDLINTINIDHIISNNEIKFIDVLKIDCEGCEYCVFFNMKASTFIKIGAIRMEYHSGPNNRLISCLKTNNFDIIKIKRDSSCLHARQII